MDVDVTKFEMASSAVVIEESSNPFQLITYFFDIINGDTVNYNSNITDNWVENNTAIHDHIAISPITVTLSGFRGDAVFRAGDANFEYLKQLSKAKYHNHLSLDAENFGDFSAVQDVNGKLTKINALTPPVSNVTRNAINVFSSHKASVQKASQISNTITARNLSGLSAQMNAYSGSNTTITNKRLEQVGRELRIAWEGRKNFFVTTPFGSFENMYIQSVTLHQANELYVGDLSITLKQIRFADTITTEADQKVLARYNAYAQAKEKNYGSTGGENSQFYNWFGGGAPYINR